MRWFKSKSAIDRLRLQRRWLRISVVCLAFLWLWPLGGGSGEKISKTNQPHFAKIMVKLTAQDQTWLASLKSAYQNPLCRGVLLFFDQAIGDANNMAELEQGLSWIHAIKEQKPVVSFMYGYTLGNNYVLASAAHRLISQSTTSLGGIGLRTAHFDYSKLMDMVGVEVVNKGFGKLKTQPKQGDENYEAFQDHREGVMQDLHQWLLDTVKNQRQLSPYQVSKISQGQWYLGQRSQSLGLCDQNGDELDALAYLRGASRAQLNLLDYDAQSLGQLTPKMTGNWREWSQSLLRIDVRQSLKQWLKAKMHAWMEDCLRSLLSAYHV